MVRTTSRILAKNQMMNNDTRITGLNNNDLIIGPSGAGKTRNYVKPNIMQCNESMIIADTKGNLIQEMGVFLEENGYQVISINFKNLEGSYGYNPFDFIRYNKKKKKYVEQDIITMATSLVPITGKKEPFWECAAKQYLTCLIAYVLECLPKREHTMKYVYELFTEMYTDNFDKMLMELEIINPKSFALQTYKQFRDNKKADKMDASIRGILSEKFNGLLFDEAMKMYTNKTKINFKDMGKEKTAVFLTISDTDRSMDRLVGLFYTQALQELCNSADMDYCDYRLPIPVRFIMDDFATNAYIPDFDNIISVIRSREIYVSLMLQSISQLEGIYGKAKATTIINNCDNCLYFGGQDVETARYIGIKANKTMSTILNMSLSEAYLFTRGQEPQKVEKFNICEHQNYRKIPEFIGSKQLQTDVEVSIL